MPNKKPLTNTNGLIKEFSNGDTISVKYGGTGKSSLPKDTIIVGNTNDEVRTIKFKFDAINAPTSTDDVNSGYSVGSKWYDVNNNIEYTCLDNTNNNAVWKSQTYGNQGAQGYQGSAGVNGTQGNQGYQGSAGVNGTYRIHSAMMGSATSSLGFFSIHPQNINPFDNALTNSGDLFNNGKLNPIMMPFNWKLSELHVAVGHCAVAQSTTASTVTMRIEFFSHTGISRTSIGFVDVPLDGTNCGIYNNLGSNNFQTKSVTNIINITGNANDMIGWQFTNRGASNDQINAVAQVTIESKFEQV